MVISCVIPSITKDFDTLDMVVDSIVADCPHELEVLVVSPHKIKHPKVIWVKDEACDGSCSACNLGAAKSRGDFIATATDDTPMKSGWWDCINGNSTICSLRTGEVYGKQIPHTFCMARGFYEGDVMKGNLLNPALFHMYIDVDLGLALANAGIPFRTCSSTTIRTEKEDHEKMAQKNKLYRLDGMIFNRMWKNKYPEMPLFTVNPSTDEALEKITEKQLEKNIFKDLN